MATSTYEATLELAASLSAEEKLRLIRVLLSQAGTVPAANGARSILELRGLGAEVWGQIDAQEYVDRERDSWNG